jgi:cytochrome P450
MCLLRIFVTDIVNALYNFKTPALPRGDTSKAWKTLHKIFYAICTEKRIELESDFTKCKLHREDKNSDERFAELKSMTLK